MSLISFSDLDDFFSILILITGVGVPCVMVLLIYRAIRKKSQGARNGTYSAKEQKVAELKRLKDQGLLSGEEYRDAVRKLLG